MKKIITLILIAIAFASAGMCQVIESVDYVSSLIKPLKSGKYKAISKSNTYSSGKLITVGGSFSYTDWDNEFYSISCKVIDINTCYQYKQFSGGTESYYQFTLDCSVSDKIQFYSPKTIYYKDVKGYRNDGTLQWTREHAGSIDITCYSKNGLNVTKRVNSPKYCN